MLDSMQVDPTQLLSQFWSLIKPVVEAGAVTTGVVEAGKYITPSLVSGKESDRASQVSVVGLIAAKTLGIVSMGWMPLLGIAVLAPFASKMIHDVALQSVGDKVLRPILGPTLKPISKIADSAVEKALGVFSEKGKESS